MVVASVSLVACGLVASCGGDNGDPPTTSTSSVQGLGNFGMNCSNDFGSSGSKQQKQAQFQQQRSCSQNFKFQNSKVADFDFDVDCDRDIVAVQNKGLDMKSHTMQIGSDGSVKGKMQFQQAMQSDGKSGQVCWVQFEVVFDGKASCRRDGKKSLNVDTQVQFQSTTMSNVSAAGIPLPGNGDVDPASSPTDPVPSPTDSSPTPSPTPSPTDTLSEGGGATPTPTEMTPTATPSPSGTSSPSPTGSPSPSPSPRPSHSHTPTPTPTVIPVVVCTVVDTCPIEAKTDFDCN